MSDTIANMLTAIRNANSRHYEYVDVKLSKLNQSIAQILKEEKYIVNFRAMKDASKELLRVYLKYRNNGSPVITGLKRISKPSLRIYVKCNKIPRVLNNKGIAIISTSKGVVADQKARELKLGGEVICFVW